MHCPFCNHIDSKVIDSRDSGDGIRRRRECLQCGLRHTTYERVQTRALMVSKRDGRREEFHRDKLWASLTKACAKRPLPTGSIEKALQEIEGQLADSGRAEVPSKAIGELVMERLKKMDRVAYIRFASVYRDFRDIETFKEEIEALLEPGKTQGAPDNQLSFLDDEEVLTAPRRRRGRPAKHRPGPS
jgi:transcriptional repressor NrdR